MYYRVTWSKSGKHKDTEHSVLFENEKAAKSFADGLWKNPKVLHVEIEGNYNSKGEKI